MLLRRFIEGIFSPAKRNFSCNFFSLSSIVNNFKGSERVIIFSDLLIRLLSNNFFYSPILQLYNV
jgi:hypothetical protein